MPIHTMLINNYLTNIRYQYNQTFAVDQQKSHNKLPMCGFVRILMCQALFGQNETKSLNWLFQETFVREANL